MTDIRDIVAAIDRTGATASTPSRPVALNEENLEKILSDPNVVLAEQQRRSLTSRLENLKLERQRREENAARPMRDVIAEVPR